MFGSKLTAKGQTTIPKEIRDFLGIQPGDRVIFHVQDGDVLIQPLREDILDHIGSIKPKKVPENFDAVRKSVKIKRGAKRSRG